MLGFDQINFVQLYRPARALAHVYGLGPLGAIPQGVVITYPKFGSYLNWLRKFIRFPYFYDGVHLRGFAISGCQVMPFDELFDLLVS